MPSLLASTALRRHRWVGLGLTLCLVLALGGSLAYLLPSRAHAATIPVSTCTESALDAAVAAASPGDTIQFGCSGTITLTSTLVINKDLTLDGSGQNVTLSGGGAVQVLDVLNSRFTLNHLTIADGLAETGAGLEFFVSSSTPGLSLTLTDCTFTGNTARSTTTAFLGLGGGLDAGGDVIVNVTNCAFIDNTAQGAPGVPASANGRAPSPESGPGNKAGQGEGGGIFLSSGVVAALTDCTFRGNTAQGGAGNTAPNGADGLGGGLYNGAGSTLTVTNSTFSDNTAQGGTGGDGTSAGGSGGAGSGGGVFNQGTITVTTSTLASNTAVGGVGGQGGTGAGGNGGDGGDGQGGGLYTSTSGTDATTFTRSTVASNSAQGGAGGSGSSGGTGGAGQGGGIFATTGGSSPTGFVNSTLASNSAQGGAGGASSSGPGGSGGSGTGGGLFNVTVQPEPYSPILGFVTIAANTVQPGAGGAGPGGTGTGGISEGSSLELGSAGTLYIVGTIVSSDPATNCGGFVFSIFEIVGGEIDSGASCHFRGGLVPSGSNTDPMLGPLANNGGPTQTMALLPGSPAVFNFPQHYGCSGSDQRGVSRPQGPFSECSRGAYEFVGTTTTTLTASPNPGLLDQPVQLCATVKPTNNTATPSGSASFKEGSTTLGTATLSGGKGCFTTSGLSLGDHTIIASFGNNFRLDWFGSTSAPLVVSIQVQGQDVAGGGTGGGNPPYNPPQSQATGGQNASGSGAGQTQQHQQSAARQPAGAPWLGTGLGLLLLLLGLGGLGGVFYRASRRPAPDMGAG